MLVDNVKYIGVVIMGYIIVKVFISEIFDKEFTSLKFHSGILLCD